MPIKILIFILGSVIGSFLNVCIYRLPRGESLAFPPSHCPHCNNKIRWFDNIPIISYALLRARCRFCARPISSRYVIVELTQALLLLAFYEAFGLGPEFFIFSLLGAALITATFIDFEHQLIPDVITLPGIFIGLAAAFLFPSIMTETESSSAVVNSLAGILAGGGSIYAVGLFGRWAFKKEAMGGGDVKLMAMIGAFIGWKLVLLVFFTAPFFGSVVGIILKIKDNREIIPYGPYISLAAIITIFYGNEILKRLIF